MTAEPLDLGHGVTVAFTSWRGHDRAGLLERHPGHGGEEWSGSVLFDLPGVREAFPGQPVWTVNSLDPLDLSPSLLCRGCGHHGFIRQGRWVPT